MYGLVGLAGMSGNLTALHAHHHAPRIGKRAIQASLAESGAMADAVPGVSGQGNLKFKVLYTSNHLPPEAQKVLVNAHGGFAVDRRPGKEETYFGLPGAGILQISADLKTINLLDTPDEMRKLNLHDTNIWYDKDGTPYLVFPANNEGKILPPALMAGWCTSSMLPPPPTSSSSGRFTITFWEGETSHPRQSSTWKACIM